MQREDWLSEHRAEAAKRGLAEMFIADLKASWAKHGTDILNRIKNEDPILYRKIMKEAK